MATPRSRRSLVRRKSSVLRGVVCCCPSSAESGESGPRGVGNSQNVSEEGGEDAAWDPTSVDYTHHVERTESEVDALVSDPRLQEEVGDVQAEEHDEHGDAVDDVAGGLDAAKLDGLPVEGSTGYVRVLSHDEPGNGLGDEDGQGQGTERPAVAEPVEDGADDDGIDNASDARADGSDTHREGTQVCKVRRQHGHGGGEETAEANAGQNTLGAEDLRVRAREGRGNSANRDQNGANAHHGARVASIAKLAMVGRKHEQHETLEGSDPRHIPRCA